MLARVARRPRARGSGPRRHPLRDGRRGGLRPLRAPLEARTLEVNRPTSAGRSCPSSRAGPIGEITRKDVRAWFRGLHATPAARTARRRSSRSSCSRPRSGDTARRTATPAPASAANRQARSERFLTPEEYCRLTCVLAGTRPAAPCTWPPCACCCSPGAASRRS